MLATLLDPHQPGQAPISLSVGDPRGATPSFVMEALNKHAAEFGEYPPINGTAMWRNAACFSSAAVTSSRTTWMTLSPTMPSAAEK